MTRCPRVRIWQSLDRIDRSILNESWATVARMPGTLLAAMATPMPVSHTRMARSASLPRSFFCRDCQQRVRRALEILLEHTKIDNLDPVIGLHVGEDALLVGDVHGAGVDSLVDEALCGYPEVQPVTGVVAKPQQLTSLTRSRDERHLDRFLSTGDQVEPLLKFGQW